MVVTATEFKMNLGKYLDVAKEEEVTITKNGHEIARLVPAKPHLTDSFAGILKGCGIPEDIDAKEIRAMRLEDKYGDYL